MLKTPKQTPLQPPIRELPCYFAQRRFVFKTGLHVRWQRRCFALWRRVDSYVDTRAAFPKLGALSPKACPGCLRGAANLYKLFSY
jgi:hypothetical protein